MKVNSDLEAKERELSHISEVMQLYSFPQKYVDKAMEQMQPRSCKTMKQDEGKTKMLARIPNQSRSKENSTRSWREMLPLHAGHTNRHCRVRTGPKTLIGLENSHSS